MPTSHHSSVNMILDNAKTTLGQAKYVQAILDNPIVICVGPAGSGKTHIAAAMAVALLCEREVRRVVLTRPAVEAGEKLGFLPGDLTAKISPYLRPVFDCLKGCVDNDQLMKWQATEVIEVAPLAYMRGRTLNDCVMVLDEGQNTTVSQMKMFLTRMGRRSKVIVTGDTSQSDLARGTTTGLADAVYRLGNIPGIAIVELDESDIVRHPLVSAIVRAYDNSY